jgi:hypothetical protein
MSMAVANILVPGSKIAGQIQDIVRNHRVGAGLHALDGQIPISIISILLNMDSKAVHADHHIY